MSRLRDIHNRSGCSTHSSSLVKYRKMVHPRRQDTIKTEKEKKEGEEGSSLTTIVEKQNETRPDGRTMMGKEEKR